MEDYINLTVLIENSQKMVIPFFARIKNHVVAVPNEWSMEVIRDYKNFSIDKYNDMDIDQIEEKINDLFNFSKPMDTDIELMNETEYNDLKTMKIKQHFNV